MVDLRAHALAVAELRDVAGATGACADRLRALARQAFAPGTRPLRVRDTIGPIYRRVPGAPVVSTGDPTPDDLDVLLAGRAVPRARAAATWRLVETVVAGLAWASVRLTDVDLPAGLLVPTALAVPPVDGLSVGWCPLESAAAVPALRAWLTGADAWTKAAAGASRPAPDLLLFRS